MALYSKGKLIDSNLIFSSAQVLPNNTSVDSTNAVHFTGCRNGKLQVNVVASTDFVLINNKALTIAIQYGTTSTPATSLYDVLYTQTAGVDTVVFTAGDTICQYTIPAENAAAYDYCELVYTTTATDLTSDTLDAFIAIIT